MPKDIISSALYTEDHEWIFFKDDHAIVGITDYAQKKLGDVVFVELPNVGQSIEQKKSCAVIESVKAASDIYAPLSGTILDTNQALEDNPHWVNESPYEKGFLFHMKPDQNKQGEKASLLNHSEYEKFLQETS